MTSRRVVLRSTSSLHMLVRTTKRLVLRSTSSLHKLVRTSRSMVLTLWGWPLTFSCWWGPRGGWSLGQPLTFSCWWGPRGGWSWGRRPPPRRRGAALHTPRTPVKETNVVSFFFFFFSHFCFSTIKQSIFPKTDIL